jgi:hypothetical protein
VAQLRATRSRRVAGSRRPCELQDAHLVAPADDSTSWTSVRALGCRRSAGVCCPTGAGACVTVHSRTGRSAQSCGRGAGRCRDAQSGQDCHAKVVGSSPIIRFTKAPLSGVFGFYAGAEDGCKRNCKRTLAESGVYAFPRRSRAFCRPLSDRDYSPHVGSLERLASNGRRGRQEASGSRET